MSELNQPHDRFFSKTFSQMETAEDILINNIPQIANLIAPGTLEDCQVRFVNPELKKFYSDILLKAILKNGETAYIYILLEHKSYHEPKVALDLTGYMLQAWDKVEEKQKSLPFIFPIVIYHGKQKWTSDTNFASLINIPENMEQYVPHFNYHLFDLSQYSDEQIKGTILSRVILLLFKHIFDDDFDDRFIEILKLLGKLGDEKTALEFMRSVLEYIGSASDKITPEKAREGIKHALPQTGENEMPTLIEQLREEARQEERKEGIRLALEVKYGSDGLAFFDRIKDDVSLETLNKIKEALRKGALLDELEKLVVENNS